MKDVTYIYIIGPSLHGFAMAYVFPSEQQPNSLPAHAPIKLDCDDDEGAGSLLGIGTIP